MVVDDHPLVRRGIVLLLSSEAQFAVIAETGTGEEAITSYAALRPDVILVDLCLPDMDGVAVTMRIRKDHPNARVVILTSVLIEDDVRRAVEAGVRAYALKDMQPDDLRSCLAAVASGRTYFPPAVAIALSGRAHYDALSPKEREVLGHMGRGLTNKAIARLAGVTEGTVKTHVKAVLGKLRAGTRTEAVVAAYRRGLIKVH